MNKEPKEVDWSNQKPGTIGVTRDCMAIEFIGARDNLACFYEEDLGFVSRFTNGKSYHGKQSNDILLPWESCIAEGHNPAELTNSQVGEGWKLKALGEQVSRDQCERWAITNNWVAADRDFVVSKGEITTHRVPITKPKRRIPCGPEHFPPGTILRHSDYPNAWQMVIWVQSYGIGSMDSKGEFVKERYGRLVGFNGQRSIDGGKTWLPCYVETEE